MNWPTQSGCDAFYGNPRGASGARANPNWYALNIVEIAPPFKMHMDSNPITKFPVHRKCADAFGSWLNKVWSNAGHDQSVMAQWGMDIFSGSYEFRTMRGLSRLSMHAYGCAIDIDAPHNAFHSTTPRFATLREQVVKPFLELGGVWGGDWNGNGLTSDERRADGMHFQFAHMG